MTIEQLVFFTVPHQLWHGSFIHIGQLYGPVNPAPVDDRLAVKLSIPVLFRQGLEPLSHADQTHFNIIEEKSSPHSRGGYLYNIGKSSQNANNIPDILLVLL